MLSLLFAVFFFWSIPLHYAARLLLDTDRRYLSFYMACLNEKGWAAWWARLLQIWMPRLLGAAAFGPLAIGAWCAVRDLPTLANEDYRSLPDRLFTVCLVMACGSGLFIAYTLSRRWMVEGGLLGHLDGWLDPRCSRFFRVLRLNSAVKADGTNEMRTTGRLVLFVYAGVVIVILIINPLWLARLMPLALAIPLLLGAWVPLLSIVGHYGRLCRAPLILVLILIPPLTTWLGAAAGWTSDNHDVRIADAISRPDAVPRLDLRMALDQWMSANACAGDGGNCPRPIIVAAAGGASRAGFFTASTIGHFLDATAVFDDKTGRPTTTTDDDRFVQLPHAARPTRADVANRLFALSGVSGGAFGAVVTAAALAERPQENGPLPCNGDATRFWYGRAITTTQDCLEALTAGDYLTPTFFGLAFHDWAKALPVVGGWIRDDRAALLEEAWQKWFVSTRGYSGRGQEDPGLEHRLYMSTLRSSQWVPLLVLNGTSVATGQRIISSDLLPFYSRREDAAACTGVLGPQCQPVFRQSLDFQALIKRSRHRDLRLSTAATNSARFPILSPPGAIPDPNGNIVDRVVDGGYFENFGALSALELAEAMVALEPQLAPFFLVISNDPESTALGNKAGVSGALVADIPDAPFFTDITGPLATIGQVRSGRGRLAVADLLRWSNGHYPAANKDRRPTRAATNTPRPAPPASERSAVPLPTPCPTHVALVQVWPQTRTFGRPAFEGKQPINGACAVPDDLSEDAVPRTEDLRQVSMSWWLSKPVQINLHQQLEANTANNCNNDAAIAATWTALQTRSGACYGGASAGGR